MRYNSDRRIFFMNLYGYVRVSDASQNEARQLISMSENGVLERNIFVDKQSGKDFERKAYQAMLRKLRPGDCVILSSLDRLGRDYAAILENWRIITKERGADIVVLDMELLDTRVKNRDLTGRLICDIVLSLLSYCAQKEREHIRTRQAQGIAAAKQRGVSFGRPGGTLTDNFADVMRRWQQKEITPAQAIALSGVSKTSFYRKVAELCPKEP